MNTPSVCLVHSPCPWLDDDHLEPPLGLLYLAAVLREDGIDVAVVDLTGRPVEGCDSGIPDGHHVYGFSTLTVTYGITLGLATAVRRRNPSALLVAGGPHATALPQRLLDDGFDVVVRGEGERSLRQIVRALGDGAVVRGIVDGVPEADLDLLPFPAFDQVDVAGYTRIVDRRRSLSVLTSRGCPYRCTFCSSNIMGTGRPLRFRSPENVAAELSWLDEGFGIRHIRFQDDLFTVGLERIRALAPLLARQEIVYRCFARVGTCSAEMCQLLAGSGCRHVSLGIESGCERILRSPALNKGYSADAIRATLQSLATAGLTVRIYLLVGVPGETDDTVAESIEVLRRCPWQEFIVYPLIAYPGTPLFHDPARYGITWLDPDFSHYIQVGRGRSTGFTIRTASFDEDQVRIWRDRMILAFLAEGRRWAGDSREFQ